MIHDPIRIPRRRQTMDAVVSAFVEIGRLESAKFWAQAANEQEALEREAPQLAHLYDNWLREACQMTGVEFDA